MTAVSTYELQPDVSIWANAYDIFRFSERPGERSTEKDDPRLESAVIRPMESDGEHFLSYYLSPSDEAAEAHKTVRREGDMSLHVAEGDVDYEGTAFEFKRDYEAVKIEAEVNNEFILVFDEGGEVEVPAPPSGSTVEIRGKGAYYKGIERKMLLKKKRADVSILLCYVRTEANERVFSQERRSVSARGGRSCIYCTTRPRRTTCASATNSWPKCSIRNMVHMRTWTRKEKQTKTLLCPVQMA